MPSALAFLINGEPQIVENFILKTLRLQVRAAWRDGQKGLGRKAHGRKGRDGKGSKGEVEGKGGEVQKEDL